MMIEQHYDEEVLAGFLGEPIDSAARDKHLASCSLCKRTLDSLRGTASLLKHEEVWERQSFSSTPRPETLAFLRGVQKTMSDEDVVAEIYVKQLLAGSRDGWAPRLAEHPEWRTAGVVRKLIAATDRYNYSSPLDAVELTRITTAIAESLPSCHGRDSLLADAWREHAYALTYTSSYREALVALDAAEIAARHGATEFDHGRLTLMRALIYRLQDRPADAAALAHSAATIFHGFGDIGKFVSARMTEAIVLYDSSRYREALSVLQSLSRFESAMETSSLAMVLHNRALCYRELGDFDLSENQFVKAVSLFEQIGADAMRNKAHWHLARVLVRKGDHQRALPMFERLRLAFAELGMPHEMAYISVDMAETLLVLHRTAEVAELCRSAMDFFTAQKITDGPGALTALAYLHEAAKSGQLTIKDVSDVRGFFDSLKSQPTLLFARPLPD
ncbi:MAG TPA: tetratricopeptide repeat protein [Thermoanaerobaculia bacterium]|nr:tetratricopeptide repeat protein [Thermoanaerobaculia bacterium]